MKQQYQVEWKIDIWASSPEEAALEARRIQQDPASIALSYEVTGFSGKKETVDLWERLVKGSRRG